MAQIKSAATPLEPRRAERAKVVASATVKETGGAPVAQETVRAELAVTARAEEAGRARAEEAEMARGLQVTAVAAGGLDELATLGADNFKAYLDSAGIFARGVEDLSKEFLTFAQAAVEANLAAVNDILAATSVVAAFDAQVGHFQERIDELVSETARLNQLSLDLSLRALQPIQDRASAAAKALLEPIAA